eukprot:867350-Pyramimonas_sp.AAC.1
MPKLELAVLPSTCLLSGAAGRGRPRGGGRQSWPAACARPQGGAARDVMKQDEACLLYTSPSPRDRSLS